MPSFRPSAKIKSRVEVVVAIAVVAGADVCVNVVVASGVVVVVVLFMMQLLMMMMLLLLLLLTMLLQLMTSWRVRL